MHFTAMHAVVHDHGRVSRVRHCRLHSRGAPLYSLSGFYPSGPRRGSAGQAIQHDPYPLDDVGPEIVGGRPLAYQRPVHEVDRARIGSRTLGVLQPIPVPGTSVVAPPVVSSPFAVAPPQPARAIPLPRRTASRPIVTTPPPTASPYPAQRCPGGNVARIPPRRRNRVAFQPQQRPPY